MDFNRNNLDRSSSPYLRQHQSNPIWWQEWDAKVVEYARKNNKPLFVSVGYATCHWCHVMAEEVFNSPEAAEMLNRDFVSVKVDREQRPDIDRFMISLSYAATGTSGWPLNAFLTPEMKAITALTYIPLRPREGVPGFVEILPRIKSFYEQNAENINYFEMPLYTSSTVPGNFEETLISTYDLEHGGTPNAPKFPPHSLLLFSLYYHKTSGDIRLKAAIEKTLDMMLLRGLNDHLQGGFYRYCVDEEWTIPHFEKMLYDQALLLWIYSLAYKSLKKSPYEGCVHRIIKCLEESFESDGLFFTGHDADTNHREGEFYLWDEQELRDILGEKDYERFSNIYEISIKGNFEGKNHLVKRIAVNLDDIENKLLEIRRKRDEPFVDKKILTDLNCLTGIGYIHAYRCLNDRSLLKKAENIFAELMKHHFIDDSLFHSSFGNIVQKNEFMQDYAAMLLFVTYLQEETREYHEHLQLFYDKLLNFKRDGLWIESDNPDFFTMPSDTIDHSHPSSASVAELAISRTELLQKQSLPEREYHEPLSNSFLNISTLLSKGLFHTVKTPAKIEWSQLPINSIQIRDNELNVCYKNSCKKELSF
jgi:uncharacterized protein YyaL (SSP411 family)